MENRKSKFAAFLSSIIAGIIVAMVVYFGLNFAGYSEYKANAKLITSSVENSSEENLAESYAQTLNSKAIKERTLENLKIDWPVTKFDNKLSLTPIKSSAIIDISVVDSNKQRAEDLADEFADLSATVLNNIYNSGANVMEYSYQNSRAIDNTPKYAGYAGLAGFIIYLVISLISVSRHNHKLEKNLGQGKKEEIEKSKKQVKKNKKAIKEQEENREKLESPTEKQTQADIEKELRKNEPKKEEIKEKKAKESTRPLDPIDRISDDVFATRKIDSEEIESAMKEEKERLDQNESFDTNLDGDEKYNEKSDTNLEEMPANEEDKNLDEAQKSNKLEILGKLPKYKRGALDV